MRVSVLHASKVPEIVLADWRILQSCRGELHFVGVRLDTGKSHSSSAISHLNLSAMTGMTRTGSTYRVVGLPASDDGHVRILSKWCAVVGEPSPIDVTAQVLSSRSRQAEHAGRTSEPCLEIDSHEDVMSGSARGASA
jgi:hypothetical protein